jgi:hypothetical protein
VIVLAHQLELLEKHITDNILPVKSRLLQLRPQQEHPEDDDESAEDSEV